jgi:hypothetical protein
MFVIETLKTTTKLTEPTELLSTEFSLKMQLLAAADGHATSIELCERFLRSRCPTNTDRMRRTREVAPELAANFLSK